MPPAAPGRRYRPTRPASSRPTSGRGRGSPCRAFAAPCGRSPRRLTTKLSGPGHGPVSLQEEEEARPVAGVRCSARLGGIDLAADAIEALEVFCPEEMAR